MIMMNMTIVRIMLVEHDYHHKYAEYELMKMTNCYYEINIIMFGMTMICPDINHDNIHISMTS